MVTAKDGIWRQKGPFRLLLFAQFLPITQSVHGATGCDSPQCNGAGDLPLISVEAFGGAIDVPKFLEAAMHSKTFFWLVGACVLVLALGTSVVAQDRSPEHFRGIINDFTPAHDAKGKPSGPWELHGAWRLDLSRDGGRADFSADLTMENSDYWLLINPNPPADPDSPAREIRNTHHIKMKDAQVTWESELSVQWLPVCQLHPCHYDRFHAHRFGKHYRQRGPPTICPARSAIAAHGLRNGRNPSSIFERYAGIRKTGERPLRLAGDQRCRSCPGITSPDPS